MFFTEVYRPKGCFTSKSCGLAGVFLRRCGGDGISIGIRKNGARMRRLKGAFFDGVALGRLRGEMEGGRGLFLENLRCFFKQECLKREGDGR